MKARVTKFKNLAVGLKELEPFIRNGTHLRSGRPFASMDGMRSREALANWLICAALNGAAGKQLTFSSDPTGGDGFIIDEAVTSVEFSFPTGCKIMVDGAIRLLSLVNQLAVSTRRVRLNFEAGEDGTMGYLNRMGFFDHLNQSVEVVPHRPHYSAAQVHRGGNQMLVEIQRISRGFRDPNLPVKLSDAAP